MTSHWNAEICLWPFQLRSIANSLRDLNLDCWETKIPWTKTYRYYLRANFESNDSYEPSPSCWKTCGLPDATVSSHYIHKNAQSSEISTWILLTTAKKPNYFCCWAPSAMAFNELFDYTPHLFQHRGYFENIWLFIRSIRLSQTLTTT